MWDDPIVAEVRLNREKLSVKFGYDVRAIFDDLRQRQGSLSGKLILPKPRDVPMTTPITSHSTESGLTIPNEATGHDQLMMGRVGNS